MTYYILNDKGQPEQVDDIRAWGSWFEANPVKRIIGRTVVEGADAEVSTVFLGINHNFFGGDPLLFETMIFGGEYDQHCWRHTTKAEAIDVHAAVVGALLGGRNPYEAVSQ